MRKIVLLTVFLLVFVGALMAQTPSRVVQQQLALEEGDVLDIVTNTGTTHSSEYILRVLHVESGELRGTDLGAPIASLRIAKVGNATVGFNARAVFNQSIWPAAWPEGSQLKIMVWYNTPTDPASNVDPYPALQYAELTQIVPAGTGVMSFLDPAMIIPPYATSGPTDYTISGMFTTTSWDFADINIVATGIDAEDIVINGANYEITVPEGWSGTVTPTKAGYIMTPANREYTNVEADFENQNYAISKNVDPNAPVITYPAQGQVFEWEEAGEVSITWTAGAGYVPEYYEAQWNGGAWVNVGAVTQWTTPEIGEGEYTFKVRAVIDTPMGKSAVPVRARATDRSANNSVRGTGPEAQVDFEVVIETPPPVYTLTITSDPVGAAIYVGGVDTGEVAPFDFTVAGTYSVMMDGYTWAPEEYVWDGMADDAIEFVGTLIPADYDIDPETPAVLDPQTVVEIAGPGFVGANIVTPGAYTPVPNPTFVATSEGILQLVGTGEVSLTFDFDPAVDWFVYLEGGEWIAVAGPLTTYTVIVDLGAKDGTFEYKAGSGEDPTLPVELSVFNATLTAQNFVKLSWTSESETNMLGYRVYRAESEVQAEAILITPIMIQATNTSTTQNYSIEDREVNIGTTYYYWLEAVDYSHSSFFGHRSVEVLGEITPELPVQSVMSNAYPNPFRASSNTTIEVKVRADETGTVTIYNVLGQAVKTYTVSEGNHKLTWNGRDSRGNLCGSGIYFARMSTPSMNQTKKMVIVK